MTAALKHKRVVPYFDERKSARRRLVSRLSKPALVLPGIMDNMLPRVVVGGQQNFDTPGTHNFVVPNFTFLRIRLWGAGGSGGVVRTGFSTAGNPGGATSCLGLTSNGGGGGLPSQSVGNFGPGGAGGSGLTQNGGNGGGGGGYVGGNGGSSPFGGSGSLGWSGDNWSAAGGFPGGGSGGVCGYNIYYGPGGGGAGGYTDRTLVFGQPGAPSEGQIVSVVVGTGGASVSDPNFLALSGPGGNGRAIINWS